MATKYTYTQIPADTFEKLAVNAGVLLDAFDPETREIGKQIGATTGGISITAPPEFSDMGEDIDNCPKNTLELMNVEGYDCKISGTFVTVDASALAWLIGPADVTGIKITPRMRLAKEDFKDLWYVCDYGNGGFIAVRLINALSTGGVSIQTTDRNKAQFAFEFTGHTSISALDTVPIEFYVDPNAPVAEEPAPDTGGEDETGEQPEEGGEAA